MIKFTNKFDLPESIVNAVKVDRHVTRGDISVTTLIDAPQIRMLKRKHDTEEDVSDRIWALMGTAMHHIIELSDINLSSARKLIEAAGVLSEVSSSKNDPSIKRAADYLSNLAKTEFKEAFNHNVVTESVLSVDVDGMVISGTFDRLDKSIETLQDYKNTSVWKYMYEDVESWEKQLNIYRWMIMKSMSFEVKHIEVIAVFRDWSENEMKRSVNNYPKAPIMKIPIRVWSYEETEKYIKSRVALHVSAEMGHQVDCTGKERWSSSDSYKVKVKGKKRAIRTFPLLTMANDFIDKHQFEIPDMYIETFYGDSRRCDRYCPVSKFCEQNKKRLEQLSNQEPGE